MSTEIIPREGKVKLYMVDNSDILGLVEEADTPEEEAYVLRKIFRAENLGLTNVRRYIPLQRPEAVAVATVTYGAKERR